MWRPKEGWNNPHTPMQDTPFVDLADAHFRQVSDGKYTAYEDGADAMLRNVIPLLTTIHAQLCGVRITGGKTPWHSALDDSIDKLKAILGVKDKP